MKKSYYMTTLGFNTCKKSFVFSTAHSGRTGSNFEFLMLNFDNMTRVGSGWEKPICFVS